MWSDPPEHVLLWGAPQVKDLGFDTSKTDTTYAIDWDEQEVGQPGLALMVMRRHTWHAASCCCCLRRLNGFVCVCACLPLRCGSS